MSARFAFEFFTPNKGAPSFVKANFNVELWIGQTCLFKTKDWSIRESKEGKIFPVGPQKKYAGKDGKDVYFNIVLLFPDTSGNEGGVTPEFKKFQEECLEAYTAWVSSGSPRNDSARKSPRPNPNVNANADLMTQRVSQAGPGQPIAGWTAGFDRQTNRRYYTNNQGEVAFEGDPRLSTPAGNQKPTQPQNDPFSFGSVPGR